MRNLKEVLEIIQEFKKLKNDTQVAVALDMTADALHKHKERKTLPVQQLLAFCEMEHLSSDWLILGRDAETTTAPSVLDPEEISELKRLLKSVEKKLK